MAQIESNKSNKKIVMTNTKLSRVSLGYKTLPATVVVLFMGWTIKCLTGNPAFPDLPVPLVPAEPVDLTTRMVALQAANKDAGGGGTAQTAARDAALEFAFEGLDANAFHVQTIARTNLPLLLTSGYQAVSTNRGQVPLVT